MIIDTTLRDVSYFSSSQAGAPQIDATDPSGLLKILDFCLITGGVDKSVVSVEIESNNVTLGYGLGHDYRLNQVILVTGANDANINGLKKITALTSNTVTFVAVGALNNQGSITTKLAPLGWESIFGKTDPLKRAYRSRSQKNAKRVLYLDMGYPASAGYHASSPARRAMVSVCDDMQVLGTQINSLTDTFNNKPSDPNGNLFWYQARDLQKTAAVTTTKKLTWKVVGNKDFFYLLVAWNTSSVFIDTILQDCYGFGEHINIDDVNPECTFLSAISNKNDNYDWAVGSLGATLDSSANSNSTITFKSAAVEVEKLNVLAGASGVYSGSPTLAPYPSSRGYYLFVDSIKIVDSLKNISGFMPSMLYIGHSFAGRFDDSVIDGVLVVAANKDFSGTKNECNIGFYVGG